MLPTLLALVLFAFATGIFAVLSALEKPIYPTMWDHDAPVPEGEVRRNSLPGRMLTDESVRSGWLYLDTWYVAGPWESSPGGLFTDPHSPEYDPATIDFDAVFTDGKFADEPDHPRHTFGWEFLQEDGIRIGPPGGAYGNAEYYAYTEVYSDKPRTMVVAMAVDDAAKLWVNGELIWTDEGLSPWRMGEAMREVELREGNNTILMRVINGPAVCFWSVLLCPPEVLDMARVR